ncbi:MAG: DinB family protein [Candidatus Rokubacteria bacterium]|nr:DinB family protein [Candidatus Rokubacteria bacterium]
MASAIVNELRKKSDAAWVNLTRQLQGMEPHLDRADAPGQWTTRQVLAHLLGESGRSPVDFLRKFSDVDLPVSELTPGQTRVTAERERLTLRQLLDAVDAQRREVFAYLEGLTETELKRRARIPFLKQFRGTDEVTAAEYVGLLYDLHWDDHAGQLAKIRKAVGL